jgi:hypothetical protein
MGGPVIFTWYSTQLDVLHATVAKLTHSRGRAPRAVEPEAERDLLFSVWKNACDSAVAALQQARVESHAAQAEITFFRYSGK